MLGLDQNLQASLLPRSIGMPFAIILPGEIRGISELTAISVVFT